MPATGNNHKELSVLWQQQAAEYRALCYQAFNMAGLRLNEALKNKPGKQKLAIITDLDETILNNSYSEAQLIKDGKEYSNQLWKDWIRQSAATGVPGAVEFLQMAQKKGIVIFYISNRDKTDVANTLINLRNCNCLTPIRRTCFFCRIHHQKNQEGNW